MTVFEAPPNSSTVPPPAFLPTVQKGSNFCTFSPTLICHLGFFLVVVFFFKFVYNAILRMGLLLHSTASGSAPYLAFCLQSRDSLPASFEPHILISATLHLSPWKLS